MTRWVAGIDGCRSGWVCVYRGEDGLGAIRAMHLRDVRDLLELPIKLALIDIPIGLPYSGSRRCDLLARQALPGRKSSVFPAPIRPAITASTRLEASVIGRQIDGRALGVQTWGIVPKIREIDTFLGEDVQRQHWLREVHPEVSFAEMNRGLPMAIAKRRHEGQVQRKLVLTSVFGSALDLLALKAQLGHVVYQTDDLLDALAALWSAERMASDRGFVLPPDGECDAAGLRMEICV